MSSVSEAVGKIRAARYGREVRESIAAAIECIDDVAEAKKDSAAAEADRAALAAEKAEEMVGELEVVAAILDDINGEVV